MKLWLSPGTILRRVTLAYAAVLLASTHIPGVTVSFRNSTPVPSDKLAHLAAYGVLGFLFGLIAVESRWSCRRGLVSVVGAIAVFGLVDELTQPFVGRTADRLDWVADMAGGAAGLALAALLAVVVSVVFRPSKTGAPSPRGRGGIRTQGR